MKILLIQTAFIGDAILATALLEKLHQFYPEAKIDFLVRKGNESLFLDHPFLNNILVFNKKEGKLKNLKNLLFSIRKEKYDIVINAHRFASTGILAGFSGAKEIIGFDKNPLSFLYTKKIKHEIGNSSHEVERNQLLIESLTDKKTLKPKLHPRKIDFDKFKPEDPYICMAPSSVWFTKQWPEVKWMDLAQKLSSNYTIYLLGAPSDTEKCEKIVQSNSKIVNLAGKLSFLESTALISNAKMNFVNDSAPLHMASATNAPCAALFCSTVPEFGFTPLSDISFVFESEIKPSCKPCGLHGKKTCPEGHFKCSEISIDRIITTTGL